MFKSKCHKCGRPIFNGIPAGEDIEKYIAMMKAKGYTIGHDTKTVGSYGVAHEVPIKPICSICLDKERGVRVAKDTKKAIRKISPTLKKQFSCPICEQESKRHDNVKIFKSSGKAEMMEHIRKHNLKDIQDLISF